MVHDKQPLITGFAPVYRSDARVLVLGSMPGMASLQAAQYYAHPRNLFWPIMGQLCGAGLDLPYAQRLQRLCEAGIALWDVLQQCQRDGSLDGNIRSHGLALNDFAGLLEQCVDVRCICLNGTKAAALFHRHAVTVLENNHLLYARWQKIAVHTMPSTSPAYASMPAQQKHKLWQQVVRPFLHQYGLSVADSQHRDAY